MSETKARIRSTVRRRVAALDPRDRAQAGAQVADAIEALAEFRSAGIVLAYMALPDEVPAEGVLERMERRGLGLALPRCEPAPSRAMYACRVEDAAALAPGRFGVREPPGHAPALTPADIDFALVPGVAWCRRGTRLGRGAGFYDRFLAQPGFRGVRCGVFFACQEHPDLPRDSWDVPLDLVVTENEVVDLRE